MRTYGIVDNDALSTMGLEEHMYHDEFVCHVVYTEDGDETYHYVGSDGGEPEDKNLYRDFGWVINALQNAYNKGYQDAKDNR